jgi:AcrR family transcriptional regulator
MQTGRPNRGPAAAAENRGALIKAAREVFAADGYEAPLNAVAKRAGVGQGSLYRHFPDRVSLALAAFEENVDELEALAKRPGSTLEDCLTLLTEQAITAAAFLTMRAGHGGEPRIDAVAERVAAVLEDKLPEARRSGIVRPDLTADDLLTGVGMVASFIAQFPSGDRRDVARQAWALLRL